MVHYSSFISFWKVYRFKSSSWTALSCATTSPLWLCYKRIQRKTESATQDITTHWAQSASVLKGHDWIHTFCCTFPAGDGIPFSLNHFLHMLAFDFVSSSPRRNLKKDNIAVKSLYNTESINTNGECKILTFWASLSFYFRLYVLIWFCIDPLCVFFLPFWTTQCFRGCTFFLYLYVVLFLGRLFYCTALCVSLFGFLEWSRRLMFLCLFMNPSFVCFFREKKRELLFTFESV